MDPGLTVLKPQDFLSHRVYNVIQCHPQVFLFSLSLAVIFSIAKREMHFLRNVMLLRKLKKIKNLLHFKICSTFNAPH